MFNYCAGSLPNIGAIFGSLISGPMMVSIGQRKTLLMAMPVSALGWIALHFSTAIWQLQVIRFIHGIIIGIYLVSTMNYATEISPTNVRGRVAGSLNMGRQFGFMAVYAIGGSGLQWRTTCLYFGVTTVVPFLMLFKLYDSPRWLASKSRHDDARKSLLFFRCKNYEVDKELSEIEEQLKKSEFGTVIDQFKKFKDPSIRNLLLLLTFLFFASQLNGHNSMATYATTIFQSVDSDIDCYLSTNVVGGVRVLGTTVYLIAADKIPRKVWLIGSLLLSSSAMMVLGIVTLLSNYGYDFSNFNYIPIVSITIYTCFACIAQSLLLIVRGELLPNSVRSLGGSIIGCTYYVGGFLISYAYQLMAEHMGTHGTFIFYAINGFIILIVTKLYVNETYSKSLEDIEKSHITNKAKETDKISISIIQT